MRKYWYNETETKEFEQSSIADIFADLDCGKEPPGLRLSIGNNRIYFPMHADLFDALSDFLGEIRAINEEGEK